MRIFKKDGKVNFVDENNVFVGFCSEASCCENFGFYFTKQIPSMYVETPNPEETDYPGWSFDIHFYSGPRNSEMLDEGSMITFRLVRDQEEMFLTLYNAHNGYYSHGFIFNDGHGGIIKEGDL